jgi:hypothetical protein
MTTAKCRASILDAETGSNETYQFEAAVDLFTLPADDIVNTFIASMSDGQGEAHPLPYELNFAIKKSAQQVVMATGSLIRDKGEIPFLLMISP